MKNNITLNESGNIQEFDIKQQLPLIGSHNTFTYCKPKNFWNYFCIPFARCQSKNICDQINSGIRVFDIRCRFDGNGYMQLCHGLFNVKLNIWTKNVLGETILTDKFKYPQFVDWFINEIVPNDEQCIFRLVLETSKEDIIQEIFFTNYCKYFQNKIKHLPHIICGCVRKFDWKKLHNTEEPDPSELQCISSYNDYPDACKARWYEKICPWLYAKRTNKHILEKIKKNNFTKHYDYILYDFV